MITFPIFFTDFGTFGRGWLRRVAEVEDEAIKMIPPAVRGGA